MPEMINIAQRMFDTPLLIAPGKAQAIASTFGPRVFGGDTPFRIDTSENASGDQYGMRARASLLQDTVGNRIRNNPRYGYALERGVAIIPVIGTLVHRGSYVGESSGTTSYEGLRAQITAAAEDEEVRAIALEIDSYGGEVSGCFELCGQILEARLKKPIYAILAENACSAGYAIASQASIITVTEFGCVGSVGVVSLHVDYSANLKKEGVKVTIISSGEHKAEGNPYEALPDSVKASWQKLSDKMRVRFAAIVGEGRGDRLTAEQALKSEAAVFNGADAVARGFADEVKEPRAALEELIDIVSIPVASPGTGKLGHTANISNIDSISVLPEKMQTLRFVPGLLNNEPDLCAVSLLTALGSGIIQNPPNPTGDNSGSGRTTGANSAQSTKEANMPPKENTAPQASTPEANGGETQPTTAENQPNSTQAIDAERSRAAKITAKVAKAGLPTSLAAEMISDGISFEAAMEKIIDAKADAAQDGGNITNIASSEITGDGVDRMKSGMTAALMAKANMKGGEQNEFTGMTLREMARETLTRRGLTVPTGGVHAAVGAAFVPAMAGASHGTSDFSEILADVANKAMLKGATEVEETFDQFTRTGTLSDFKPSKRVGLSLFPALEKVDQNAEFKYGTMGDYGESIVLATYGKMFAISRQTIINDDLNAFTKIPMNMGRAARRTVGNLVFAILTANAAMADGTALFHADHNNLAGSSGVPSEASINAAITAMATQKDRGEEATALNIAAKFLIAPPSLRSVILQALNSEYAPDDTAKAGTTKQPRAYNTVKDAATPIFDARLTGSGWYVAADPNQTDTIEVAYLDGNSNPFLEQQAGWSVDGTEFKVRIDAGVAALAWEGLFKNAG